MKYKIAIKDKKFEVEVCEVRDGLAQVFVNGESYEVVVENYAELVPGGAISQAQAAPAPVATPAAPKPAPKAAPATAAAPAAPKPAPQAAPPAPKPEPPAAPVAPSATPAGGGTVIAPIPGLILDVKVKVGDQVLAGETVAVMEAMKMENNVVSDNFIQNCGYNSPELTGAGIVFGECENNIVQNNLIYNCYNGEPRGIFLYNSNYTTIEANTISLCHIGAQLRWHSNGCTENVIHQNNFLHNSIQ